jgi:hypothetical protein
VLAGAKKGRRWARALVGVCTLGAASAAADPASREYRLVFEAPPTCPDASAFEAEISARTLSAVRKPDAARTIVVSITISGAESTGSLQMREPDGTRAERRVQGGSCRETVSALALVAALALDPNAALWPQPTPAPARSPPAETAPPQAPPAVEPPRSVERWSTPITYGSGIQLASTAGVGPGMVIGGAAFFEAGPERAWVLRISLVDYPTTSFAVESGAARFALWTGRLEPCRPTAISPVVELSPCVGLEVGRHTAEAEVGPLVVRPIRHSVVWGAAVGVLRAAFDIGAIRVEAQGDLTVPLVREKFVIAVPDEVPVYRAPAIAAGARLGVGMHFAK